MTESVVSPGWQREDIGALDLGAAQQDLGEDLVLQQLHRLAPLAHVPPLLYGVGHVLVPPAVVLQRAVPARQSMHHSVTPLDTDQVSLAYMQRLGRNRKKHKFPKEENVAGLARYDDTRWASRCFSSSPTNLLHKCRNTRNQITSPVLHHNSP